MRRVLFRWHLAIGQFTALLLMLWSLTASIMLLGGFARRALEPKLPSFESVRKQKPALRAAGEIRAFWAARLAATAWSVSSAPDNPALLQRHDDFYEDPELPVYRLSLDGPGRYYFYVSARDGELLKKVSSYKRFFYWAGWAIHTWEIDAIKRRGLDDGRRLALFCAVALPVLLTGLISYTLFWVRKGQVPQ